jgi:hypothetical protein
MNKGQNTREENTKGSHEFHELTRRGDHIWTRINMEEKMYLMIGEATNNGVKSAQLLLNFPANN